ncbi:MULTISPECIES: flagellar brake protein [Pseudomonas]|uniref:Pilus assembly protein PilZ n=1 Tax=Pseudomonas kuykendallii TaxID=1007099 RepID=A0A2W5D7F7_9PSED|nr:flagellar brake protein [Pseudomonas sp. UBA3153]PZP26233.1 MAG: pilus assembly protein PilZ [Pseudomonas kuykendallii]
MQSCCPYASAAYCRENAGVPNPFIEENGPQEPRLLRAPLEIFANLRLLQQNHDPLVITFEGRSQRFQSFVVQVDRERNLLALDELIPNDGERYLQAGESFHVEGFHEGVRIAWDCEQKLYIGELEGARAYWATQPEEMLYHQRRGAFRAVLKLTQPVQVSLDGDKLRASIVGQMLDISATGCKLRFAGDVTDRLNPGEVYERLTAELPFGAVTTSVELRHQRYDARLDVTFCGLRFFRLSGLEQRAVERFVYQLQREARRLD